MSKWTNEEKELLIKYLERYPISDLPFSILEPKLRRSKDAIKRKALRLMEESDKYEWTASERQKAFTLYLEGKSFSEIKASLPEISLDEIEQELKRLRNAWTKRMQAYAEERNLPVAKHFKLDTIDFFIQNKDTDKDFIKKVLHGKLKNG